MVRPMSDTEEKSLAIPRPKGLPAACSNESYYLAVRAWATGHDDKTVAAFLGVPVRSLRAFTDSREWFDVVKAVRAEYDDYDVLALTRLYTLSLKVVADALDRGDPYIDIKTGQVKYKRITGRDAAAIAAMLADQRSTAQKRKDGEPDNTDVRDELMGIAAALRELGRRNKEKSIDGESVRIDKTTDEAGAGGDRA